MEELQEFNPSDVLKKEKACLYIYTPFCGTCQLARRMVEPLEKTCKQIPFYEMNASYYPDFMQEYKIKSVPCLLIISNGKIVECIYAFQSVPYLYTQLKTHFDNI